MRKNVLITGLCCALGATFAHAASESYPASFPAPQAVVGLVDDDDSTFLAPNLSSGTSCANDGNELANQYDTVPITNNGSNVANVVFTLSDVGGAGCSFPNGGVHTGETPRLTLYTGSFNPAQPTVNCQDVRKYSGSCPALNFQVPVGATYTVVVSSNRAIPITKPDAAARPEGTSGLFGYQGGFNGSTPVSLQSFSVDQDK